MRLIATCLGLFFTTLLFSQQYGEYYEGEIIVKLNSELSEKCNKSSINIPEIESLLVRNKIISISKLYPKHKTPKQKRHTPNLIDLSTIYKFSFNKSLEARKIINQLSKSKLIEYAELNFKNELCFIPSDTLNTQQYYLEAIKAYQAWDLQKGDTNVIIGIGDTGIDSDHPDMINDYAKNYNDPINGIDDDNDGYIDNFMGWDFGNDDNNPELLNSGHGINVSGIASASTNNVTGISGVGYKTKILALKIDSDVTGGLVGAYDAIVYAADFGAPIISNSWGSTFYSKFAQDIINYATLNKGCLVIAATGNNGFENRFYPAAYENVLAVGASERGDTIKSSSNYGYWTDIYAPGDDILTCNAIGGYGTNGGTSMAAPIVAGVAALIKSQFPNYTWQQITEQIINTGDNIYAINDSKYTGKLGGGRVNAFRAVSEINKPGIALMNKVITDHNDGIFQIGDTLRISGDFKNWLANATNVHINVSTVNNRLQVLNGQKSLGNINHFDSVSVSSNPFSFKIPPNLNFNELIEIEISITADNYTKKIYYPVLVNVDYITVNENNLEVSIPSNGGLGYGGPNGGLGEGFIFKNGNSLVFEGGFMVGNSSTFVANKFRAASGNNDNDFLTSEAVKPINSKVADFESKAVFNDGNLNAPPTLEITAKNYVFKQANVANTIIYEYTIKNISGAQLNGIYGGLAIDWDIADYSKNRILYEPQRRIGVSFATDTALYCGVKILTDSISSFHYAIDNTISGDGGIVIADGFSVAEKFQSLSSSKNFAGAATNEGNDIVDVNSIGPFDLSANSSKKIAFSITISDSLPVLYLEADSIQELYNRLILSLNKVESNNQNKLNIFPNPAKNNLNIELELSSSQKLQIILTNAKGSILLKKEKRSYSAGKHSLNLDIHSFKSGVYFLEIKSNTMSFQDKFVVTK